MKNRFISKIVSASLLLLLSSSAIAIPLPALYFASLGAISMTSNIRRIVEVNSKERMIRKISENEITYHIDDTKVMRPWITLQCKNKLWQAACSPQQGKMVLPITDQNKAVTLPLIEPNDCEKEDDYKMRVLSQIDEFKQTITTLLTERADKHQCCRTGYGS